MEEDEEEEEHIPSRTPPLTPSLNASPFSLCELPADSFPQVQDRFPGWNGLSMMGGDPFLDAAYCKPQGYPSYAPEKAPSDVEVLTKAFKNLEEKVDKLHDALTSLQTVSQAGLWPRQRKDMWEAI